MTVAARLRDRLMETSLVYRVWQAPFAEQKLAPVLRDVDVRRVSRVLDLACGPGTNAHHFAAHSYTGVDINPGYIDYARSRHEGRFLVADASASDLLAGETFDLILVNSFLHHLPDDAVRRTLARAGELLIDDGEVHILDLVLPSNRSLARFLARADRGNYVRPLAEWKSFLERSFEPVSFELYPLTAGGMALWHMFHFTGTKRFAGSDAAAALEAGAAANG